MRIIKKTALRDRAAPYSNAKKPVETWIKIVESTNWKSFADLRSTFREADQVKLKSGCLVTVFNICKNEFRLIAAIHYNSGRIFIREFLTHHEYDRNQWKLRN